MRLNKVFVPYISVSYLLQTAKKSTGLRVLGLDFSQLGSTLFCCTVCPVYLAISSGSEQSKPFKPLMRVQMKKHTRYIGER